jgi:RecB family exonuclease
MVLGYLRDSDPYYEPLGVERTVAFTTERASLRGRVDRIDERPARDGNLGTELAIVDYKTGRRPLTSTDARSSLAMALYVLGARRVLHRACTRVELHHLPTNTVAAADHDDESLARHQRRAESIADDAAAAEARWREGLTPAEADEVFPPEPSPLCGWCDFARICPQGRRVAPPRDPWAGLDEPEIAEAG